MNGHFFLDIMYDIWKISRNMVAGHTYLIIFTQFDPANEFTDYNTGDDVVVRISFGQQS